MNIPEKHCGIVLLAAGSSERLGQNKLSYQIDGISLLEKTIQSALGSLSEKVVLVGGYSDLHIDMFDDKRLLSISNKNWRKGIGSSIKCGLNFLLENTTYLESVIISVCDQPFLTSKIFNDIIKEYQNTGYKIVASNYGGTIGVPVLYGRSFFDGLLSIPDHMGAKKHILDANPKDIISIPFPQGNIDIDTQEDIDFLKRQHLIGINKTVR